MKYFLNCRSLIKVAVIIVVMAFMASQVTDTYAKKKKTNRSNDDDSSDDKKWKKWKKHYGDDDSSSDDDRHRTKRSTPKLRDISGLVWIKDDVFLAVSDAKHPDEDDLTRVSLLTLPSSIDGIGFRPLSLRFPGGPSSDFESAAGIPGSDKVLLVESADDNGPYQRIFLAKVVGKRVRMLNAVEWGSFTAMFNVESSAVADTGSGLIFIWAERNSGEQSTDINWTDLQLDPFVIGGSGVESVMFTLPADLIDESGDPLYSRPFVGMDVDSEGNIYSVAAFDPEGLVENPDIGPFRSVVFKIGKVIAGDVVLDPDPTVKAIVDGFKVESVAVRENGNGVELFFGTDDEDYGGTLRPLVQDTQ